MNWIPQLATGYFAIAGLACAAGPIVIHLLNRRRYRRVEWAAMDFLAEALQQQRRRLNLRDLLLLFLRRRPSSCSVWHSPGLSSPITARRSAPAHRDI